MGFVEIAEPLAKLNVPVTPVRPGTKRAFLPDFPTTATTDIDQIYVWGHQFPDHNVAAVARAEEGGVLFFEVDSPDVLERIKAETGHDLLDEVKTYRVRSRPGRGHFYFRHNAASMNLGNISQTYVKGQDWSLRTNREYVVGAGSLHPETGEPYTALDPNATIVEAPEWLLLWLVSQKTKTTTPKDNTRVLASAEKIKYGAIHGWLVEQAGRMRQASLEPEEIETALLRLAYEHCQLPLDDSKIRQVARSMKNYAAGFAWQKIVELSQRPAYSVEAPTTSVAPQVSSEEDDIPVFNESVINGIYREIVEAACNNTTIPRQFAFLAAKVYIGAMIAGKVTFENLDTDSSYYGTVIGVTGTGKGLSWERTVKSICNVGNTLQPGPIKIINGADSGAGLKDAFFDPLMDAPIICYVDEITSLGHKASEKKNPEIIDTIIELANSHTISRTLAARGKAKATRSHPNARLSLFVCGQTGEVITAAFSGRTKLGIYERLYPEYSPSVIAGRLPKVDPNVAVQLWSKINQLPKSGEIKMAPGLEDALESFWTSLPNEMQTRVRLKSYLAQDMFMSAYGRGSMVAELGDLNIAIKIFQRQIVIRLKHFTDEVPDKVGLYLGRLKKITEQMRRRLRGGETLGMVAKSLRDFQTETGAYRDNELHTFNTAWRNWEISQLAPVDVTAKNGHKYPKFVPVPNEDELWKE